MDEELLGIDTGKYPARGRRGESLGKLHTTLQKAFPDYRNADGSFATAKLAKELKVSYQAAYKWFDRERISTKRVKQIVELSKAYSKVHPEVEPLTFEDFMPFMGD